MARPTLLAVDDDPQVLRAVTSDLKRRYGDRYRVVSADSGAAGLELAHKLRLRNDDVALFLSDQRMPQMSGTEFLTQSSGIFPRAKRILLTAYADTNAAIEAINRADVHYYLLKPWHPPEEKLFPVLDDFLDDWQAHYRPAFDGLRVLAYRWTRDAHTLKTFLARNQVPYRFLDVERVAEAKNLLADAELSDSELPAVLFPDGTALPNAAPSQVAERLGLKTHADAEFFDLVIIGAGPAGLAAAVYGASEGLHTLLVERDAPGGQAGESSRIENYLGFPAGIAGSELSRRATTQARRFGVDILCPQEAVSVEVDGPSRRIVFADGGEVLCHVLLIASGVSYRRLEAPGLLELTGTGVYYGAAATEAPTVEGRDAYVVGGGNSAGQAAMYFSRFARSVTILIRGDDLTSSMSQYLIDQIDATPNITVRNHTRVVEARGEKGLEQLVLRHDPTDTTDVVEAAGLFVFIGALPHTEWLDGVVRRDAKGFVLTGTDLVGDDGQLRNWPLERDPYLFETSVPGIFAAGDVRSGSVKRVASGVGEGSVSVSSIHRYLATL
ncbi:MAG TPA: FAD-dependent oxidoreductase [Trueperaceae bacterium]|nr:FAD-dependent oxidoreductase [Trueperaceae bacterium]